MDSSLAILSLRNLEDTLEKKILKEKLTSTELIELICRFNNLIGFAHASLANRQSLNKDETVRLINDLLTSESEKIQKWAWEILQKKLDLKNNEVVRALVNAMDYLIRQKDGEELVISIATRLQGVESVFLNGYAVGIEHDGSYPPSTYMLRQAVAKILTKPKSVPT